MTATPPERVTADKPDCPPAESLHAYAFGRLSDDRSAAVFEHLSQCENCASELETLADSDDSLIASLRQPDSMDGFDDEPDCQVAVAKALGALAKAGDRESAVELDSLPQKMGEYEIVRPLGQGGMGRVYLARHTKLGREVAIKVLASHRLGDSLIRQRFEAEMRAVGRLSHPNIITAHDAREIDGTAVLVTEFIDGLDLGRLVQSMGPLQIADACEIARLVAVALAYTDDQGFVHRDIKPSNIMLSRAGEVKLLDLGLARFQDADPDRPEITGTGQAMGTADYLAPEQVTDSRSVDIRADIYSLGCTLLKLLTGEAPFAGDDYRTPFAKMTAHVSTPPPSLSLWLPEAPTDLVSLIALMMKKDPADRPQTPMQVAERLEKFSSGSDLGTLGLTEFVPGSSLATRSASRPIARSTGSGTAPHRKRVPLSVAIALGFFGILIGIVLGMVIKIRYPDGTVAEVSVPAGSQVTIENSSEQPQSSLTPGNSLMQPIVDLPIVDLGRNPTGDPMWFVVLLRPEDLSKEQLRAIEELRESELSSLAKNQAIIPTQTGLWIRLSDQAGAPIVREFNGHRYALASSSRSQTIQWQEIIGGLVALEESADEIGNPMLGMQFNHSLAKHMHQFTTKNLGRPLALVVDNTIRIAPRIMSPIGKSARFAGRFTKEDIGRILQPILDAAVDSAKPVQSVDALEQFGRAFHNFHSVYKKLPGSRNVREGKRGIDGDAPYPFSWRVALLPFIEHQELLEQYRFDEPWDSESNGKLLAKMPPIYRSPFAPKDQSPGETNFMGFATERGALGTSDGEEFRSFLDGLSNTILLVETKRSVPWTKPEDLTQTNVDPFDAQPLRYLLCDGSVGSMDPVDQDRLDKLITRNGKEMIH